MGETRRQTGNQAWPHDGEVARSIAMHAVDIKAIAQKVPGNAAEELIRAANMIIIETMRVEQLETGDTVPLRVNQVAIAMA